MLATRYRILASLPFLLVCPAFAQQGPASLADCAQIGDSNQRLACFDRLAAANAAAPTPSTAPAASVPQAPLPREQPPVSPTGPVAGDNAPETNPGFSLDDHWELDQKHKRGVFNFRPHHPNYLLLTHTWRPNNAPYEPFRRLTHLAEGLSHNELAFQLGFKIKLIENAFERPLDLWFGYTQNSFWQASNHKASSPFRETNYQPELMAVTPLHFSLFGVNARYLNLGLVHQSNGQTSTLSRSWNRVYVQMGVERGGLTVVGRVWTRIGEKTGDDDNPNIIDYMGRGDIVATYRADGNDYSALLRHNFATGRGAVQLSWAWPLAGHIKGYAQLFSGYGQSLIDYNYYQRTVGLGLLGTF
jgi:phospholipase A1